MECTKAHTINLIVALLRQMPAKYAIQWQKLQANAKGGPKAPHELHKQTVKGFYRLLSYTYLNSGRTAPWRA